MNIAISPGDVLTSISNSPSDFRTTDSLAREFDTSRELMVGMLDALWREGKIRHPVGWEYNIYYLNRNESDWWRYVSHGYTRGEKWRMTRAIIGMSPISDGSPSGGNF